MSKVQTIQFDITDKKTAIALTVLLLAFFVLTLTQDYLRSGLNHSAFYFSEALMFSSFWWLFAPILFIQCFIVKQERKRPIKFQLVIIILPIIFHLLAFPSLIWLLSTLFYYHTYSFQQTLRYVLSEYLYLVVIIYSIFVLTFRYFPQKAKLAVPHIKGQEDTNSNQFIRTILISEGNKKHNVIVSEILFFSANPPYISLHLEDKKYLHAETLKSILTKLNPEEFVRVHKSTIVNINEVVSYTTRLNGDYDLAMKNNVRIRVSRNFAPAFKKLFIKTHHFTLE